MTQNPEFNNLCNQVMDYIEGLPPFTSLSAQADKDAIGKIAYISKAYNNSDDGFDFFRSRWFWYLDKDMAKLRPDIPIMQFLWVLPEQEQKQLLSRLLKSLTIDKHERAPALLDRLPWFIGNANVVRPFDCDGALYVNVTCFAMGYALCELFDLPKPLLLTRLYACYQAGLWPANMRLPEGYRTDPLIQSEQYVEYFNNPDFVIEVIDPEVLARYPVPPKPVPVPAMPSWWDLKALKQLEKELKLARAAVYRAGLIDFLDPDGYKADWVDEDPIEFCKSKAVFKAANREWLEEVDSSLSCWMILGRTVDGASVAAPNPAAQANDLAMANDIDVRAFVAAQQHPGWVALLSAETGEVSNWFPSVADVQRAFFWVGIDLYQSTWNRDHPHQSFIGKLSGPSQYPPGVA